MIKPSKTLPGFRKFSPDRQFAVCSDNDLSVRSVADGSGAVLKSAVKTAFSPDSKTIAVANRDGSIWLYSLPVNKPLAVLQPHAPDVASALFSPDGKLLALNLSDGTSRLHSAKTGNLVAAVSGKQRIVAFQPHGHTVISQDPSAINIWNTWDLIADKRKVR
jgi:WD40 repeat protein